MGQSQTNNLNSANTNSFMNGWGSGGGQNFNDYLRSAMASSGVMDPASIFGQFSAGAPGLMQLALDATNPYVKAIDAYANSVAGDAAAAAEAQYSDSNAIYSSGALDSGRKAARDIYLQAQTTKTGAQTSMLQTLLPAGMSMLSSARSATAGLLGQMVGVAGDIATPVLQTTNPTNDAISMGISGIGALAGLIAAPATGGMSLAATAPFLSSIMPNSQYNNISASGPIPWR
jgi:hypothetical protein